MFLIIFSFQVLPVKLVGKLLCKGQNTEEVQQDGVDDTDGKAGKFSDDQIAVNYVFDVVASGRCFNNKLSVFIHRAESLPSVHIAEMLSPPPDC
jgi:hypothetical protein